MGSESPFWLGVTHEIAWPCWGAFPARSSVSAKRSALEAQHPHSTNSAAAAILTPVALAVAASPDVDPDDALALLTGLIDGFSLHKLLYPDRVPDGRATELMETLLALLRPPALAERLCCGRCRFRSGPETSRLRRHRMWQASLIFRRLSTGPSGHAPCSI